MKTFRKLIASVGSVALILLLTVSLGPGIGSSSELMASPEHNHRKGCFLKSGCKHKVDRSCFGGGCGSSILL